MTELEASLEEYLSMRRALGFKLRMPGILLRDFVQFTKKEGASVITTDLALRWATQSTECQPTHWANRLGMVRQFARFHSAADPQTQIPPRGLLPFRYQRRTPYIHSEEEIAELLAATRKLGSPKGLRAATYSTLFGLLAVTGMRVSEAIGLDRRDVDLCKGILKIRQTKFNKSRLIPVHCTTRDALIEYARIRDGIFTRSASQSFFVSERDTRLTDFSARWTFLKVSRAISSRGKMDGRHPHLHDLRHGFVVRTLLTWYRSGSNVDQQMPTLSAYLGHGSVANTYWYLSGVPELMQFAVQRLENREGDFR